MTASVPADPIEGHGIAGLARRVREGKTGFAAITDAYLERIEKLDGAIRAFVHVDAEGARAAARGFDDLLRAGHDLGPLMGMPVAVKDLFTVQGMPVRCGSRVDVSDLIRPEGPFVARLRRAGCVVLGKTRTTEFASGGMNLTYPTPFNPRGTRNRPLAPGGSSNGSAAALASGLAAFTIGSDTGGSVRIPAAYCGLVGFKSSAGRWPIDGIFPLSPTLDTAGFLTHDMADAATVLTALDGAVIPPRPLRGLRLAKPTVFFLDDIDPAVLATFDAAIARLERAGAVVAPIEVPEAADVSGVLVPCELLATLGRQRVEANKDVFDPPVYRRLRSVWDVPADRYARIEWRRRELIRIAQAKMDGFDAWITPTAPFPTPAVADLDTVEKLTEWGVRSSRCTRPGNMFAQCGISIPLADPAGGPPLGLQLCAANGADEALIGVAMAVEAEIGRIGRAAA
jgi:aspartyl-tRNA(Asn)/glutamyl-tRNA(Gln) amidotransferase subunit A